MGCKATGGDCPLSGEIVIGMGGLSDEAEQIARRSELKNDHALECLIDLLFGASSRDQTSGFLAEEFSDRRRATHKFVQTMKTEAESMIASLREIHAAVNNFHHSCNFNPSLLEATLDVDVGFADQICLPDEIDIIQSFFPKVYLDGEQELYKQMTMERPADDRSVSILKAIQYWDIWEEVEERLSLLAALPVRDKVARGPMSNVMLQRCLFLVRHYWVCHHESSWTMNSLKNRDVRNQNEPDYLKGRCEKFVSSILLTAGIRFSLTDLFNAWTAFDKLSAKAS